MSSNIVPEFFTQLAFVPESICSYSSEKSGFGHLFKIDCRGVEPVSVSAQNVWR